MNIQSIVWLLLVLLLKLTSCAPLTTPQKEPVLSTSGYLTLALKFESSRARLANGEPIFLRFTIQNKASSSVVFEAKDLPVLDIEVRHVNSRQVYTSWSMQNPDKVQHRIEWQPGETKMLELLWVPEGLSTSDLVHLSGLLAEGNKVVTGAGTSLCIGCQH